jgi:hypothetical protein
MFFISSPPIHCIWEYILQFFIAIEDKAMIYLITIIYIDNY